MEPLDSVSRREGASVFRGVCGIARLAFILPNKHLSFNLKESTSIRRDDLRLVAAGL
jgi:hypothetical protein